MSGRSRRRDVLLHPVVYTFYKILESQRFPLQSHKCLGTFFPKNDLPTAVAQQKEKSDLSYAAPREGFQAGLEIFQRVHMLMEGLPFVAFVNLLGVKTYRPQIDLRPIIFDQLFAGFNGFAGFINFGVGVA